MKSIKVLDVTLRDGGCVNDFNFGKQYMEMILHAEESAGIDCIEVGYLDNKEGSKEGRTKFIDEKAVEKFIAPKKSEIEYLAMMDYGKFDVEKVSERTESSIDGIRLAFHKRNLKEIPTIGSSILKKGYGLYIQPMLTIHYTDAELLELINMVNDELPNCTAFYIVDSFGEMRANDMIRIVNLIDYNLLPNISLGFHSHNNLQLSYSNAMALLQFQTERNIILDSSILGMGKGAGNFNTELLVEHMNLYYGKKYNILPLMKVIDNVVTPLHVEYRWGYSIEYYLSSKYHVSPSYANYFYNKHSLSMSQLSDLLSRIDDEKRISFDRDYARAIYHQYKAQYVVDDKKTILKLEESLNGRNILLLAPGQKTTECKDLIIKKINDENAIVIGVNNYGLIDVDYLIVTRTELFERLRHKKIKIITFPNITTDEKLAYIILNYDRWTISKGETYDSAGIVSLKLMEFCSPKKIMLAGFDGLSWDLNKNYYDKSMRFAYTEDVIKNNNTVMKEYIHKLALKFDIEFITPSEYEYIEKNSFGTVEK